MSRESRSELTDAEASPPCVALELLVMMLITPFTALAPQTVAPGPRITSIRSMESRHTCNVLYGYLFAYETDQRAKVDVVLVEQHPVLALVLPKPNSRLSTMTMSRPSSTKS